MGGALRPAQRIRTGIVNALLVAASVLIAAILTESAYRTYLYWRYTSGSYPVTVVNPNFMRAGGMYLGYGPYVSNTNVTWTLFSPESEPVHQTHFRLNNFGWTSQYDYSYHKELGEYRVAVIGDSFVASHLSEVSWTAEVERLLMADRELFALGISRTKVYNFGVSGAGFDHFMLIHANGAHKFNPDLVVVNFLPDDLPRRAGPIEISRARFKKELTLPAATTPLTVESDPSFIDVAPGITSILYCSKFPISIDNPDCNPSNFFAAPSAISKMDLEEAKKRIARHLAAKKFLLAPDFFLLKFLKSATERAKLTTPNFLPLDFFTGTPDEDIALALACLDTIADSSPKMLVLRAPTHIDLSEDRETKYAALLSALGASKKYDYVDLKLRMIGSLPIKQNWAPWYNERMIYYNLPWDGHFSDEGSRIYGRYAAEAIKDRIVRDLTARVSTNGRRQRN
jgi:hypothetical protein